MNKHSGTRHHYTGVNYFDVFGNGLELFQFHLEKRQFLSKPMPPKGIGSYVLSFDYIPQNENPEQMLFDLRSTYEPRWREIVQSQNSNDLGLKNAIVLLLIYTPSGHKITRNIISKIPIKDVLFGVEEEYKKAAKEAWNSFYDNSLDGINNLKKHAIIIFPDILKEINNEYEIKFVYNNSKLPFITCNEPLVTSRHNLYLPLTPQLCLEVMKKSSRERSLITRKDYDIASFINRKIIKAARSHKVVYSTINSDLLNDFILKEIMRGKS